MKTKKCNTCLKTKPTSEFYFEYAKCIDCRREGYGGPKYPRIKSLKGEIWKPIPNTEEDYWISNKGRVKTFKFHKKNGKLLVLSINNCGYWGFNIWKNNKTTCLRVHLTMARLFMPNPENKCCINHKDGNKLNNSFDNLEWVTYAENNQHAYDIGLKKGGTKRGWSSPSKWRKVQKLDEQYNLIKEYVSITAAAKDNNITKTKISRAASGGRPRAGGFRWRYAD